MINTLKNQNKYTKPFSFYGKMVFMKLDKEQIALLKELMTSSAEKGNLATAALVIENGETVASADSLVATNNDMTAHSERVLVEEIGKKKGSCYTPGLTMVTVVEPCVMCMSACAQAGYKELAYIIPASRYPNVDYITDVKEGVDKEKIAEMFLEPIKLIHLKEHEDEFGSLFEKLMKGRI